jgi:hypothetical protein
VNSGIWTPKLIVPTSGLIPCPAIEGMFPHFDKRERRKIGDLLLKPLPERWNILKMAGSLAFYSSKKIQDILWGATAYTAVGTNYANLWASALDDTFNGATAGKCAYTSYAALALTNNTTLFAAGSGTTTYTKTFPSDATKSWATSTGTGTNNTVTYLGFLDANAGSAADNGIAWCTITSVTINNGDTPQLAQNAVTVVQD